MPASGISPLVLQGYRETEYRVDADPPFVLQIDCFSAPLVLLQAQYGVVCSAYITACNPFSKPAGAAVNARRQLRLATDLKARGFVYFLGKGAHPSGFWPAEPSFLIMGLDREQAMALGNQYEQNAVLCCDSQAIPRLVLLR